MSWFEKLFGQQSEVSDKRESAQTTVELMSPGLNAPYDQPLREKAGMHEPPPPPEYMGVEGEYDVQGLIKRVALAFDQDPDIGDIPTLHIAQHGSTLILTGSLPDKATMQHITEVVCKVDGSKAIDTSQLKIEAD